jgi:MFS family permease
MAILIRKQNGLMISTMGKLGIIAFIASISFALIDTIWAVYINSFVNSASLVGFIASILTLISFLSYFLFIPFIEKSNKAKIYSYSLLSFAIAYILFAINKQFYFFIIISAILTIIQTFRITSFGIIIKDKSKRKELSRNEGIMYTFANTAWVLGPLIAGLISEKYGIPMVFLLASIFILIAFFLFKVVKLKDNRIKKRTDNHFYKNFVDFFKNKDLRIAYILGGGVNFWWSLIYLFIPLLIIKQLHISWVGYFLFAIAIPLITIQYYFSKLAGKIGFKKIFQMGFLIPCILALMCFFTSNIFLIMSFLIIASIGLAMLESTTEAYFFDILKGKQDLRFYGPYNTTIDVNQFLGRIISAIILLFLPFKFIFLFYSIGMFGFFLISFKTKNIIEIKRKH